MSSGVNATEILRGIIKPQQNEDLIQIAIKMATNPEKNNNEVSKLSPITNPENGSPQKPSGDKCPLLMELLYKSFQARLAKEQRCCQIKAAANASKMPEKSQPSIHSSLSKSKYLHNQHTVTTQPRITGQFQHAAVASAVPASPLVAPHHQQNTLAATLHHATQQHQQHALAAASAEAAASAVASAVAPFNFNAEMTLALQQQQQQQQHQQMAMTYNSLFSYYPAMWTHTNPLTHQQPQMTPQMTQMIPNVMQIPTSALAASSHQLSAAAAATAAAMTSMGHHAGGAGIKRAAGPVMYPAPPAGPLEKRMKLA